MKRNFKKTEAKWRKIWQKEGIYEPELKGRGKRKKFYNLMMFPYPSAEGLHAGNMYAFTGADIYGRYMRLRGFDVFEPIGLDGFGIHSENYAIKTGTHPMKFAKISEKNFYRQLQEIGNGFAWREHLETYDPEYYKWTQWIFVQMWKAGLAYRKKQPVNWCPSCKTVLADEQVIAGKCERCGTVVVKRELEQWFFRITKYAEKLLKNLEYLDWSEKVKIAQRNWIGKSEGALIKFPISNFSAKGGSAPGGQFPKGSHSERSEESSVVEVFTTRPDTLFGATYMVLAPEHPAVKNLEPRIKNLEEVRKYVKAAANKPEEERIAEGGAKTGVELKGVKAVNPATGQEIPVWAADYVLGHYGTGAIMAVPAHDERDFEFAKKFGLRIEKVIKPIPDSETECYAGDGILINSFNYNGLTSTEARMVMAKKFGEPKAEYRLRDWLISRQRYWGPPIPMIFCPACAESGKGERKDMPGWYAEREKNLPVKLPFVKDFRPKGKDESPLASVKSFYEVKCPACKSKARRETDVSDTFLDSAWYYIGYLMAGFDWKLEIGNWKFKEAMRKWLPADMYIGGAEHSVLHLLYVRFMAMALKDMKLIRFEEPFPHFRAHGLIIKDGAKMSKSKGNVVNPDEYIEKFSADVLRTYLMFLAPFEQGGDFRDEGILGPERFLNSVWRRFAGARKPAGGGHRTPIHLLKMLHKTILNVGEDIEALKYNTAISQLMIFWNEAEKAAADEEYLSAADAESFLKLLAPFAPYLTEEIWRDTLGHKTTIHRGPWPKYAPRLTAEEKITLVIQVNGKMRGSAEAPAGLDEAGAKKLALSEPKISALLAGREPRRIIYVPGRLINIVI